MRARLPLLALLAVVAAWAVLGVQRDRQRDRRHVAVQMSLHAMAGSQMRVASEAGWAEVVRLAGDTPQVRERQTLRDTVAAQEARIRAAHGTEQAATYASLGLTPDSRGGLVAGPPGALAAVPSGWFHGVFGVAAGLLALVALAAPRR